MVEIEVGSLSLNRCSCSCGRDVRGAIPEKVRFTGTGTLRFGLRKILEQRAIGRKTCIPSCNKIPPVWFQSGASKPSSV